MDILQKTFVTAVLVAAGTGLLLTQRSLLLIDAYKFPFPLISAFLGLSASLLLCSTLSIVLKTLSLGLSIAQASQPAATSDSYVDDSCLAHFHQSNSTESVSLLYDTEPQVGVKTPLEQPPSSSGGLRSLSGRSSTWLSRSCCGASPSRGLFSCQVCFGLALALRLSIGPFFLSHVSFFTYAAFALVSLPLNIVFNYCGESASSLVLGLSEILLLLVVVVPKATLSLGVIEIFGMALPVVDSILIMAGWKALRLPWHEHLEQQPFGNSWMSRKSLFRLSTQGLDAMERISTMLIKAIIVALVAMLPLLKFSGEVGDITSNCYVSSQAQFVLRVCALGALQFAVLIGFALALTMFTPVFVASIQATLYAVLVAVIYQSSLDAMDWVNLALCWTLMVIRLFRGETEVTLNSKAPRGFWRAFRKIFLGLVLYVAIFRGCITFQEYMKTGSIAGFSTYGNNASESVSGISNASNPDTGLPVSHDGYLGNRPEADTLVNWPNLMSKCVDSANSLPVEDIANCLRYLAGHQEDYLNMTAPGSKTQSEVAKQILLPHHQETVDQPKRSCNGPNHIYHTYWTGKATWRVELFIKGFLYSQNLDCSRLWIWVDADADPDALNKMLYHDARFQRYHGLLDEGILELKAWNFPEKIPLQRPHDTVNQDQEPVRGDLNTISTDGLARDESGNLFLIPDPFYKVISTPTQISDFVRFVVLHLYGGVYLDMDVLLLRDLRPLLLPDPSSSRPDQQPAWAEQWVEQVTNPGDYNTAVLSLPANSSLTSYLLQGGKRMGMNYHPRVLGLMLWKDGRKDELGMLHNAIFDPLVTNLRRKNTRVCTVPCHKNFEASFMGHVEESENEWSNYHGNDSHTNDLDLAAGDDHQFATNRTMANFFRGAFAYHIHNQWQKFPEPSSWMDVITQAQDGFFAGERTNAYGETWGGPHLESYDRSEWTR